MTVATALGTLELGSAPANAAGPDLRELVMGSEGAFGIITSVTVRVRPVPQFKVYETWRFDSFTDGVAALRDLDRVLAILPDESEDLPPGATELLAAREVARLLRENLPLSAIIQAA